MNSRAVFVLSLPRSGSSCIAGALSRLGVNMGDGHLQKPDENNPRGYYEDLRWQRVNKDLAGHGYQTQRVWMLPKRHRDKYEALAGECSQQPVWGLKGPRMAFTFQYIHPIVSTVAEVRVVWVQRERQAVVSSLLTHSRQAYRGKFALTRRKANDILARWNESLCAGLETFDGPVLEVDYSAFLVDPRSELGELAYFVFDGFEEHCTLDGFEQAFVFVEPKLQHNKEQHT